MKADDLKHRTKVFALRIIKLVESLPPSRVADVIGRQLVRCGTSVGANYRAACRAKSQTDFIAKLGIVEEEADESVFWMELLTETGIIRKGQIENLIDEANQLVSIFVSSIKTARGHKRDDRQDKIRNPQSAIRNHNSEGQ